jgi:hypothetical protein
VPPSDLAAVDRDIRWHVYGTLRDAGRAPTDDETAAALGLTLDEVAASYRRLHEAHVLVLYPDSTTIRMALPFAAAPSPFEVTIDDRRWWANCAWDGYGVVAALGADHGSIRTTCPDCEAAITLEVANGEVVATDGLVHFLVPATRWWDDVVFT